MTTLIQTIINHYAITFKQVIVLTYPFRFKLPYFIMENKEFLNYLRKRDYCYPNE